MRLIDADELKTAFPVCDNSKPVLIASVRATINHMPTIEPQRKKGRWKRVSVDEYTQSAIYVYRCDKCKKCNFGMSNFCPNCGAEMTEDSK